MKIGTKLLLVFVFVFIYEPLLAFHTDIHSDISKDQLRTITRNIFGSDTTFTEDALDEIADANVKVDNPLGGTTALKSPKRHFTNEQVASSFLFVEELRQKVIKNAIENNGATAREFLGQALHTIQDFYSHSNWVELGNNNIVNSSFPNPPTGLRACPTNPNEVGTGGGGGLTTAYFVGSGVACGIGEVTGRTNDCGCRLTDLPAGKCFHGNYRQACIGINKDLNATLAPGECPDCPDPSILVSPLHGKARSLAEQATKDFVENFILPELAGNDAAIAELFGGAATVGFIVDDTGSMGTDIAGVKTFIRLIVNTIELLPEAARKFLVSSFLLTRFGDPDVGPTLVTEDSAVLLSAVNSLTPSGGGDCPELSQTALLQAIDNSRFDSKLTLFTDASAKDSGIRNTVFQRAQEKKITLKYIITGSCSPIDPAYIRGAEETGGQVFSINRGEVGSLFDLFRPQITGNLVSILANRLDLSFLGVKTITVPVDSTIEQLVITTTFDTPGGNVEVRRPDGSVVDETDPDVQINRLSTVVFVTVQTPGPGFWEVDIIGNGKASISIDGNSPLKLRRFEFVQENSDIHGGFFAIDGQPLANSEVIGQAVLFGPVVTTQFDLVKENGNVIKTVDLNRNFPRAVQEYFLGKFSLPTQPFRLVVSGTDDTGAPFRRQNPVVYRGRTVKVEPLSTETELVPGKSVTFEFKVTNFGSPATYSITAVDSLGVIVNVTPTSLPLNLDESAIVLVEILVSKETQADTQEDITVTATKVGEDTQFNSATISLFTLEPTIFVPVDILPGDCPNEIEGRDDDDDPEDDSENSGRNLKIAILGSSDLDVREIDVATILLAGVPIHGFVMPPGFNDLPYPEDAKIKYKDKATPFEPFIGKLGANACRPEKDEDGFIDLIFRMSTEKLLNALGSVNEGDVIVVPLTGELIDGTPIRGEDVIVID